ncbi:MAG: hypothetical protein JXK93_08270, partial [Sphaerochaetaceae bacterium]|nr:hypothetical protein [Sphaerochaetaceae bacterium]
GLLSDIKSRLKRVRVKKEGQKQVPQNREGETAEAGTTGADRCVDSVPGTFPFCLPMSIL